MGRGNSEVLHLNPDWSCFLPSTHLILYSSSMLNYFTAFHKLCFLCALCLCPPCSSRMKCFFLYFEWLVLAYFFKLSSVITSSWKLPVTLQGLPSFESLSDFLSSIEEALCHTVLGAPLVTHTIETDYPKDLMTSLLLNPTDISLPFQWNLTLFTNSFFLIPSILG